MRLLFIVVSLLISMSHAEGLDFWGSQSQISYSATRVMTSENDQPVIMKEYHAPGKFRLEMIDPETKQIANVVIMSKDQGKEKIISLIPEQKIAMNVTSFKQLSQFGVQDFKFYENKKVGSDKINGHAATKYKVKGVDERGEKHEGYIWKTKDDIIVKMEAKDKQDNFVMQLQDLRLAKQNPNLFVVPEGYQSLGDAMANFGQLLKDNFNIDANQKSADESNNNSVSEAQSASAASDESSEDAAAAVKKAAKDKLKKLLNW